MRTNMLIDELPTAVTIDGHEYRVNFGFRALVLIELCTFDNSLSEEQRTLNVLNLFYFNDIPENREEAIKRLLWFYRCGEEPTEKSGAGSPKTKRCYDFDQDQRYIYAAFMEQYGIDLNSTPSNSLHWWKFKALFESLKDDCKICEIMSIRLTNLKDLKGKQKERYKKLKDIYALRDENALDSKIALSERDRLMKEYVRKRFEGMNK